MGTRAKRRPKGGNGVSLRNVKVGAPKRLTPGEQARARYFAGLRAPTSARAVLAYIEMVDGSKPVPAATVPKKLRGRITADRSRRHGGHPTHKSRSDRRGAWMHPDEQEKHLQEINRLMREEMRENPGQGMIAGPLSVAAKYGAPMIAEAHDLSGLEHEAAIRLYLLGLWGEVMHDFDLDAYLAWREDCRARAVA